MTRTMTIVRTLTSRDKDFIGMDRETRSRRVGRGVGAKNAIEKSWEVDGDDGVTIIEGSGEFSVTGGRERSEGKHTIITGECSRHEGMRRTKRGRNQSIIQTTG